jgi:hypothetical protein
MSEIRISNLTTKIILGNDNVQELVPLFLFPKIIKNIHLFLNIKSVNHIPSLQLNNKSKKLSIIKKNIDNKILVKYLAQLQNTLPLFIIQSYINTPIPNYIFNPKIYCFNCNSVISLYNDENNGKWIQLRKYNRSKKLLFKSFIICDYACFI